MVTPLAVLHDDCSVLTSYKIPRAQAHAFAFFADGM